MGFKYILCLKSDNNVFQNIVIHDGLKVFGINGRAAGSEAARARV